MIWTSTWKAVAQEYMCLHCVFLLQDKLLFGYDLERIIDDWILMGFLVGNDFIPHLPNMHISHVSGRYTCLYHTASSRYLKQLVLESNVLQLINFWVGVYLLHAGFYYMSTRHQLDVA